MVRVKHRYFVVQINAQVKPFSRLKLGPFTFYDAVLSKVQQLHGDYGVALIKAGYVTKYCNEITKIALLRTRHASHKILASTLPFITELGGKTVSLNTLYLGATMKQCFKFIRQYQRQCLNEAWATLKTDDEKIAFEKAIMDLESADVNNIIMK